MDLGLQNKVILITGGSGGIGRATALSFNKEGGARIAITYNSNQDAAHKTIEEIQASGNEGMAVPLDLGDLSGIEKAINSIVKYWGTIDVLVNNAVRWMPPAYRDKGFEEIPINVWADIITTNLIGTVKVTQSVVYFMKCNRWGRIVTVSSDLAFESFKGSGPYSALKSSLIGLNANLVEELSPYGILSNLVLPSLTLTEGIMKTLPLDLLKKVEKAYPTKHITTPEDVASVICFLCSAANKQVNGELIKVTGYVSLALANYFFNQKEKEFA
ncbi:MAG: SDR family oxidoreductase [Chitinophagaceae bacterium]|nr:SDR family oxidoreductase [Chitinophagaceae bacterium]